MKLRKRKHLRYTRRAQVEAWFASWDKYEAYLGPRPSETGHYL
jgi:hypothetical protein